MVTGEYPDNENVVVEVDVSTGDRRRVTWVDTDPADNFMVGRLGLATGLLGDVRVRAAGSPDRGPWPLWPRVTVVVTVLALGLLLLGIGRSRRRRPTAPA
jgi:hypothetical protein